MICLSGCATVKVNGYEITPQTQAVTIGAVLVGGMLMYGLSDDENQPVALDQSNPGFIVCKVNIETGECV